MISSAILTGVIAGLFGEVVVNVAAELSANALVENYRAWVTNRRTNHDLQRVLTRAYGHALQAVCRQYEQAYAPLPTAERAALAACLQRLQAASKRLEQATGGSEYLVDYLDDAGLRHAQAHAQIVAFTRQQMGQASAGFAHFLEVHLDDAITFAVWEELKVDEQAFRAFELHALRGVRQQMNLVMSAVAFNTPGVKERLAQMAPEAEQMARSLAAPQPVVGGQALGATLDDLLADLQADDDGRRIRAAQQLLLLQSDEAVTRLSALLNSPNEDVALYAVHILATIRPLTVIPRLVQLASDQPDAELRTFARQALGRLRTHEEVSRLVACLGDLTPETADRSGPTIEQALLQIGAAAIEPLQAQIPTLIQARQWSGARYAVFILNRLAPAQAQAGLRTLAAQDPDPEMRTEAQRLLKTTS